MAKPNSAEHTRQLAAYLQRVARETRASAAEMDQVAAKMLRRLEPKDGPFPCCPPGPCLICGVDSPHGHVEVDLPGSRTARRVVMGRICSTHSFIELAMTGKFVIYIEGDMTEDA